MRVAAAERLHLLLPEDDLRHRIVAFFMFGFNFDRVNGDVQLVPDAL